MLNKEWVLGANKLKVSIKIGSQLCLLKDGNSASGKTYLTDILAARLEGSCVVYNSKNGMSEADMYMSVASLNSRLQNKDSVIVFDNADLYISERIVKAAEGLFSTIIVIYRKDFMNTLEYKNDIWYKIKFSRTKLELGRVLTKCIV